MKGNKLFVGNLNESVTCEKLRKTFSEYGEVIELDIVFESGFGFVEMSNRAEAEKAVEMLNGSEFEGSIIKVEEARPPRYKVDPNSVNGVELLKEDLND